jgi:hypothetical protein
MIDGDHCGAINGMNEWQGKPKYSEETCPSAKLCLPQMPRDLTRGRTRDAAVANWRLTDWAAAVRPDVTVTYIETQPVKDLLQLALY